MRNVIIWHNNHKLRDINILLQHIQQHAKSLKFITHVRSRWNQSWQSISCDSEEAEFNSRDIDDISVEIETRG